VVGAGAATGGTVVALGAGTAVAGAVFVWVAAGAAPLTLAGPHAARPAASAIAGITMSFLTLILSPHCRITDCPLGQVREQGGQVPPRLGLERARHAVVKLHGVQRSAAVCPDQLCDHGIPVLVSRPNA
jgi:hypothetical protein